MADIIDISELESSFDIKSSSSNTNFGGGIELLMNDKKKESSSSSLKSDIDIEDLNHLEKELNDLTFD